MDFISQEQFRRNEDSRAGWDLYTEHRRNVTGWLLQELPSPMGRLCLLGAGNCNDVDLKQLRGSFSEIHLVDLDSDALLVACQAQGLDSDPGVVCHTGIDVTGILPLLSSWRPEVPATDQLIAAALHAASQPNSLGLELGSFDVVASTGLLTQLIDQIGLTLGTKHPGFLNLITVVRLRHLQLMLDLLKPRGIFWLFTEVVSSLTCPQLLNVVPGELNALLTRSINAGNFFTGCNPAVLNQIYHLDPVLKDTVQDVFVSRPWLWKFIARTYAVCAIAARKKG